MESSHKVIAVLALAITFPAQGTLGQNPAFDNFLKYTLEGYHDWAVAKGLEPVILEEPLYLTMDYERYYYVAEIELEKIKLIKPKSYSIQIFLKLLTLLLLFEGTTRSTAYTA